MPEQIHTVTLILWKLINMRRNEKPLELKKSGEGYHKQGLAWNN